MRRLRALAILAGALLLVAAFAPAAFAQNNTGPGGQVPAPTAAPPPAPAPTAIPSVPIAAPSAPAAAPAAPVAEQSVATAELPQDLSPWGMFLHADIIVKTVMIGLALASLATWTVFIAKSLELHSARRAVRQGLRILNTAATFAQAHEQLRSGTSPITQLIQAAGSEIRFSVNSRRSSCQAMRSLSPSPRELAENRISLPAACISCVIGLVPLRNCSYASANVAAVLRMRRPCRTALRALWSSRLLAIKTVQVASEAKASPIITAFTMMSACRNMPQGERSCGNSAVATECSAAGADGVATGADGVAVGAGTGAAVGAGGVPPTGTVLL